MPIQSLKWINALIVDDSHAILNFTSAMLKQNFAIDKVTAKTSAASALEVLKSDKNVNLLFLDLNMPEMDGIQFLAELTQMKYKGFLVIMSGVAPRIIASVEELAKGYGLNYLGTLLKPLDVKGFEEVLADIGEPEPESETGRELKIYEIIRAIKNENLEVYYQPQVDLHTRQVYGLEVLVRLDHPTLGIVSPDQFLAKIEQSDLMIHMTFIILRKALRDWSKWKKQGVELKLSLNISPFTLQRPEFVDELFAVMSEFALPLNKICLEVKETSVAKDMNQELETLSRLNMKGIELALDDFGEDHASMERIQNWPINVLKLDKKFLLERKNKQGQITIIESCIAFAKRLNMITVAEGVENAEQWKLCGELGCDVAQGFYLSKPMSATDVLTWVANWESANRLNFQYCPTHRKQNDRCR